MSPIRLGYSDSFCKVTDSHVVIGTIITECKRNKNTFNQKSQFLITQKLTTMKKAELLAKAKEMGLKVNTKMTNETLQSMIDNAKKGKESAKVEKKENMFRDEY